MKITIKAEDVIHGSEEVVAQDVVLEIYPRFPEEADRRILDGAHYVIDKVRAHLEAGAAKPPGS